MKDEDLLEFGWAPGNYSVPPCEECERKIDPMDRFACSGAKRSARCKTEATKLYIQKLEQDLAMQGIVEFGELQTALEKKENLEGTMISVVTWLEEIKYTYPNIGFIDTIKAVLEDSLERNK